MNYIVLFQTSFYMLKKHKMRSFLTICAIGIGIAAMIITFSIGRGAEHIIRSQILAMGEQAIYVVPGNIFLRGKVRDIEKPARLTRQDLDAISRLEFSKFITPYYLTREEVKYGPKGIIDRIIGSNELFKNIARITVAKGTFFSAKEQEAQANVAVLGSRTAQELFGAEVPLGKIILIRNIPFTVIGVLEPMEYYWGIDDPNFRVHIPYASAKKYFAPKDELEEVIGNIAFRPLNQEPSKLIRKIKRLLRFSHRLDAGDPDDFTIYDQESIERAARRASGVITLFGLIAASISLLVAGIGIMNIMLIAVNERTSEIGVRLAIGATQLIIQLQFLIEAIVLSLIGGIIGVLLALFFQFVVLRFIGIPGYIEIVPLLIGLITTLAVGSFFGYYPARRASLLNPIDALRNR